MKETVADKPSFNLWTQAWITLERTDGGIEQCSIEQALSHAHEYRAIYDPSPLVVVGIHRLLTAIMQAIIDPNRLADIKTLWNAGVFPAPKIVDFGKQYSSRFDLFSGDAPFLQSGDLPLIPVVEDKTWTVAYLLPDMPSGTNVTHYRHGSEDVQALCGACAAAGLVTIPAFATSGGPGIKPSINGVPPIYVIPGGTSLFQSLTLSLISQDYKPAAASVKGDDVWWMRTPIVEKKGELYEVGYLHSLTFPARRVRLHPEHLGIPCTQCGQSSEWVVRTMIFEMGESRPKDSASWIDPFAAYRITDDKPTPIRPQPGKALWREFAGLFLQDARPAAGGKKKQVWTQRPRVLEQMSALQIGQDVRTMPFRCVGLRTDMKAKIFEWVDAGFEVPPSVLSQPQSGLFVREAIAFAGECGSIIASVFKTHFGGSSRKTERYTPVKDRMIDAYWAALADPFRQLVLLAGEATAPEQHRMHWFDTATRVAFDTFTEATEAIGDDATALRERVQAEAHCHNLLSKRKREQTGGETQ